MKSFDYTFPDPAENLACDEALLDWREKDEGEEILRFWESPTPFVVAGYANKIEAEVQVAECEAASIPIYRRCSGGGTVVQGPGCLNYALILKIADHASLGSISGANQYIMRKNCEAIQLAMGTAEKAPVKVLGHTDLAAGAKKFSGNSQRRHKNFLLFHGTFLLDFDLTLIGKALKFPSREPDYRQGRTHEDFLMNLHLPTEDVKAVLRNIWAAKSPLENPPRENISKLARDKYSTREWNLKFFHL